MQVCNGLLKAEPTSTGPKNNYTLFQIPCLHNKLPKDFEPADPNPENIILQSSNNPLTSHLNQGAHQYMFQCEAHTH